MWHACDHTQRRVTRKKFGISSVAAAVAVGFVIVVAIHRLNAHLSLDHVFSVKDIQIHICCVNTHSNQSSTNNMHTLSITSPTHTLDRFSINNNCDVRDKFEVCLCFFPSLIIVDKNHAIQIKSSFDEHLNSTNGTFFSSVFFSSLNFFLR